MSDRDDWSVRERTPEADWQLLSSDPLAYIRELAYAHAEKLREGAESNVIDLNEYRREHA